MQVTTGLDQDSRVTILRKEEGMKIIWVRNTSGVNLWVSETKETANKVDGFPIPPGGLFGPFFWFGDLWVSSDVNNTQFLMLKSRTTDELK
jgi:hypothetical protein